jgi:hypothetical protein
MLSRGGIPSLSQMDGSRHYHRNVIRKGSIMFEYWYVMAAWLAVGYYVHTRKERDSDADL